MDCSAEKNAAARNLADKHFLVEDGLTRIFRISDSADVERAPTEPIKLLEVNVNTIPSGILPLRFGPMPASGIPFPSIIVEVTPEEFERIQANDLKLPNGWTVSEEMQRPAAHHGAEHGNRA